jgi:hypothetical protein
MKRTLSGIGLTVLLWAVIGGLSIPAQLKAQPSDDFDHVARIDRYLDAEVWSNHSDGEYYEGDNIVIKFRVNRDAFVAIYTIDTRGRVKLLFPADPGQDNFVYGGITNSLPGSDDDYDLVITGPEGLEHIQMIASPERFPIPNWYHNSGLLFDGDDYYDYMDYLNNSHFIRYSGQRFAYDRAVIFVDEWEEYYYRPVYYPDYPSWSVYGNMYVDYPWGSSVYINGYYWGIAPLYIPRLLVGWHTITIYDHYGYCWESDFHASRYNTAVFNSTVIKTSATVTSKYASVRKVGYRDPVKSGYPNFKAKSVRNSASVTGNKTDVAGSKTVRGKSGSVSSTGESFVANKKYTRGSTKLVKTSRGYEVDAASASYTPKSKRSSYEASKSGTVSKSDRYSKTSKSSDSKKQSSGESSSYYQKKSGSSAKGWSGSSKSSGKEKSSQKSSSSSKKYQPKNSSSKSSSAGSSKSVKATKKSSGSAKKSSDTVKSSTKSGSKSSGTVKESSSSVKSTPKAGSAGSSKSGGKSAESSGSSKKRR